ncbi:MAG: DNA alkylation repair protein [Bacteroidota bacterium]
MHPYVSDYQLLIKQHADPEKAVKMQKYMRDLFNYYGIKAPELRQLQRQYRHESGFPEKKDLFGIVKDCWKLPQREFQYFGQELMEKFSKKPDPGFLDIYEYMITNKSWWDTVDFIAAKLVGNYFKQFPNLISDTNEQWLESGDIWLQRTTLLFQLKYKTKTDIELLSANIMRLKSSKEFFIRKAIGWLLREYSKTNASFVRDFVTKHELAPLSEREALKWLNAKSK